MQDPGSPVDHMCRCFDRIEGHDTIWLNAARYRIPQIEAVHIPSFDFTHATFESAEAAERSLSKMQAAHRARLQAEEDAIEAAKEALRKAYAVDDEAVSAARRALRQKRNSLLPVARLPPEILRDIFTFCSEMDHPRIQVRYYHVGWLKVTHVCRNWRNVALAHLGLWTHISYSLGPGWTETFAERAQTMPLVAHFNCGYPDDWHFQFLANNLSRMAYLDVEIDFTEDVSRVFSTGAPLLHSLKMTVDCSASAPDDLLGRHAPALRNLYFSGEYTAMRLTLTIFSHLTILRIVNSCWSDGGYNFDKFLNELLDGLQGMRELEELKIKLLNEDESGFAAEEAVQQHHRPGVTLAKLSYLKLTLSMRDCMTLIPYVSLPAHAVACCKMTLPTEHLLDGFFPLILASFQCHSDPAGQPSNAITNLHIDTVNSG
ncbi:hypothetical protein FA95DRAFT_1026921, partial [Auriscalpium vulgare]